MHGLNGRALGLNISAGSTPPQPQTKPNHHHNMTTTAKNISQALVSKLNEITINEAPASLSRYTHAASNYAAENLRDGILALEKMGHQVIWARSSKSSVPNSYQFTRAMHAPCWFFDPAIRTIDMKDCDLETRSKGALIPARYHVAGAVETPDGFRCIERSESGTMLIKR